MKTSIDIDIEDNKLYIREFACLPEEYTISEDYPACINEICNHLRNYLEGLT